MGFDIDLSFTGGDANSLTYLDKADQNKLRQLFHEWAWDNAGDLGWGFYNLCIEEQSKIKLSCPGEYASEVDTPAKEWEDKILSSIITAVKNEDYDNYAINIFIEHRKENTMPENFATFKLSVENWDEGVEIAISKEMSERVYDKLVDVFYKDYDHLDGFAYETDQLGACGDTTKVFINSNAEYDLNAYFDLQLRCQSVNCESPQTQRL